jgi:hypothetical protein
MTRALTPEDVASRWQCSPAELERIERLRGVARSLELGPIARPAPPSPPVPIPATEPKRREVSALDRVIAQRRGEPVPKAGHRVSDKTYFIRCEDYVKIGIAVDVMKRMRDLQSANPKRLELLAVVEGCHKFERSLHRRFADLRHSDEWFRLGPELSEYIEEIRAQHKASQ